MLSSERKQMEARFDAFVVHWEKTAEERMTEFAEFSEKCRKNGHPPPLPPLEIVKFPELLGRAWGWDEILPYEPERKCWSLYMSYLQEYYKRNAPAALAHQMEAGASDLGINGEDGNGLAALVNLYVNVEGEFLHRLKCHAQEFNVDEISLNDKITNCAHQITNMESDGLPIIALKCIMAEADLLCELMTMRKNRMTSLLSISCKIRKFAARFMTYKGPPCFAFAAAATMMATMREAKLMCELLRNKCRENGFSFTRSRLSRQHTLAAMLRICQECSTMEESTGGRTAAELKFDESDGRNCSEEEKLSEEDLLEMNKSNQNTMICLKEELPKGDNLEERNEDEYCDKSCSAMGIVGDNLGALNNDVNCSLEELMKGDNLKVAERQKSEAVNNDVNCSKEELMDGDNLMMGERQKTKEESLKGGNLSKSENLKIENSLLTQNCDESDDKVSLKEKVAEQGRLEGMDDKHRTKLGDLLKTSSNEGSKVLTTLRGLDNKKKKHHRKVSGKQMSTTSFLESYGDFREL